MRRETVAKRGAIAGSATSLTIGLVCLACFLPVVGGIVGISVLVTAVGGIAEDGVLTAVGVASLAMSLVLGAYVLVARRRNAQGCAVEELAPGAEPDR